MSQLLYRLGFWIRESGQALDRLGCSLQGNNAFLEEINRHRSLVNLVFKKPVLGPNAFVAPSATVAGDVTLGRNSSVWYDCVLRGDDAAITVGDNTNLQDGVVIRTAKAFIGSHAHGTTIGDNVTVGHNASIAGASIEDGSLIGINATLLEGVRVEKNAWVAANAVVAPGTVVPSGQLWSGNPATFKRRLSPEELEYISSASPQAYAALAAQHAQEASRPLLEVNQHKFGTATETTA